MDDIKNSLAPEAQDNSDLNQFSFGASPVIGGEAAEPPMQQTEPAELGDGLDQFNFDTSPLDLGPDDDDASFLADRGYSLGAGTGGNITGIAIGGLGADVGTN